MMDFAMEIDYSNTRKRCRGSMDDCSDAYPTAKKTRQFHFQSTDAADAFASAFALAQQVRLPFDSATTPSCAMTNSSAASTPNNESASASGSSSPGSETEDPFRSAMAGQLRQQEHIQSQHQSHPHIQQQPQLHPPPGRRGMIISGWNQSRRSDSYSSVVTSWPQR